MDEQSDVKAFLERVQMLDEIIENKLIEQRQWRELAESISANMDGERVQTSGSRGKMENAIIRCVDMEVEIEELIDMLIEEKRRVVKVLELLYNPIEYKILHMRYIQHVSFGDISKRLNKDYSWVTTVHGRALKNVRTILERSKI